MQIDSGFYFFKVLFVIAADFVCIIDDKQKLFRFVFDLVYVAYGQRSVDDVLFGIGMYALYFLMVLLFCHFS